MRPATKNLAGRPGRASLWMGVFIVAIIGKLSEWVPGLSVVPVGKIAFLICAIYAYRERDRLVPVRVISLTIARPAIAFLVLAVVSVVFSVYKSNSLLAAQAPVVLLIAFVVLVKITQTQLDIERQLMAFCIAAVALSGAVLMDYHGGRATINRNFDPNDLAYGLVTLLPIVLALAGAETGKIKKLLRLLLIVPITVAILLTGSRGGAIGLGVVLLLLAAFPLSLTREGALRAFSLRRSIIRVGALVVLAAVLFAYLPPETQDRLMSLNHLGNDYNASMTLNSSRLAVWTRNAQAALERPIGYGIAAGEAVDGMTGGAFRADHNSIVESLVELGILGCWLFLYSYYIAWRELGRITIPVVGESVDRKLEMYARAIQIGLAGNIVSGFFLSQAYSSLLWMMMGLSTALVRVSVLHKPVTAIPSGQQDSERSSATSGKLQRAQDNHL